MKRYVVQLMGMPISLALRGAHTDDGPAAAAWAEVVTELRWADVVFSTYRADSYLSRLSRGEIALTDCPPEVAEVLALGRRAEAESGGAFSVWLPGPDGRHLDPTGVVKGWATQRAARALERLPGTDFCLSAGGDMVCRSRIGERPWQIGIEDPADPSRILAMIPVGNGAVATSGTARRGAHLLDARTGRQPSGVSAVTVVAPELTWADIDATAAFALGAGAADWLATRPGRLSLVVWADGTTSTVAGTATAEIQARGSSRPSESMSC